MSDYSLLDLLAPWVTLVIIVLPLVYTERWIHQHLFGIGYLLFKKNEMAATRLFYVFFLPGVAVHELIQYLVAGAINAPIKQLIGWPEKQDNGTLRLDFISLQHDKAGPIRAAIVAASPFVLMSFLVWYISTQQLALDQLAASLGSGDIRQIWDAIEAVLGTSNFILWLYLLFVIANSMVPKPEDAHGIPIILGLLGLVVLAMLVVGLDQVFLETLGGPVTDTLRLVNTALGSILGLNLVAIFVLGMVEDSIERIRGEKMNYSGKGELTQEISKSTREPGSDLPYPKGELLPSIYNLELMPLPSLPKDGKPALAPGSRPSPVPAAAPAAEAAEADAVEGTEASSAAEQYAARMAERRNALAARREEGRSPLPSTRSPDQPGGSFTRSRRIGASEGDAAAAEGGDSPAAGFSRPRRLGEDADRPANPAAPRRSFPSPGEGPASGPPSPAQRPPRPAAEGGDSPAAGFSRPRRLGEDADSPANPAAPRRSFPSPGEGPASGPPSPAQRPPRPAAEGGDSPAAGFSRPHHLGENADSSANPAAPRRSFPAPGESPASGPPSPVERPARPALDRSTLNANRPPPLSATRPARPIPRPSPSAADATDNTPDADSDDADDVRYEDFDDIADLPDDDGF